MAKNKKSGPNASKKEKKRSDHLHALTRASISDLEAELSRRRRVATSLERKRARLQEGIDEIDRELAALGHLDISGKAKAVMSGGGTSVVKRRGPRGDNTKTLFSHLEEVLNGQVLSVSEAAEAVVSNGYKTSSKTFRTIVNQTLLANEVFEKIDRGRYTVRSK